MAVKTATILNLLEKINPENSATQNIKTIQKLSGVRCGKFCPIMKKEKNGCV
jgi:hypothetical protein